MMAAKRDNRSCLDLQQLMNKSVYVKFVGGREVSGVLRGFDSFVNLVLDDCEEFIKDSNNTRKLGLLVAKGTAVMVVNPMAGMAEIENPYVTQ